MRPPRDRANKTQKKTKEMDAGTRNPDPSLRGTPKARPRAVGYRGFRPQIGLFSLMTLATTRRRSKRARKLPDASQSVLGKEGFAAAPGEDFQGRQSHLFDTGPGPEERFVGPPWRGSRVGIGVVCERHAP